MAFNYYASQARADALIRKRGYKAYLRRTGMADRPCTAVEVSESPTPRVGAIVNPTPRIFLIAPIGLTLPPNNEKDSLVTLVYLSDPEQVSEVLRIIAPPEKLDGAGVIIYWEIQVAL